MKAGLGRQSSGFSHVVMAVTVLLGVGCLISFGVAGGSQVETTAAEETADPPCVYPSLCGLDVTITYERGAVDFAIDGKLLNITTELVLIENAKDGSTVVLNMDKVILITVL